MLSAGYNGVCIAGRVPGASRPARVDVTRVAAAAADCVFSLL